MTSALIEPQTVTIEGREYTVRRLNVKDVFSVGRILGLALARGGKELQDEFSTGKASAETIGMMFIASVPFAEEEVMRLCGSLINVSSADFARMPADALIDVAEVISQSEDLKAFLDKCLSFMRTAQGSGMFNRAKK